MRSNRNIPSDELYDHARGYDFDSQQYWINKHYKGWEALIRPCIDRAVEQGHLIQQIKAKFGSLRFYYRFKDTSQGYTDKVMQKLVHNAETLSFKTCTNCGLEDPDIKMGYCKLCEDGWIDRLCKEFGVQRKD